MKKIVQFIAAFIILTFTTLPVSADGTPNFCGAAPEMLDAQYWIGITRGADKVIMTADEARAFSGQIRRTPRTYCVDVLNYPPIMGSNQLKAKLKNFSTRHGNQRFDVDVPVTSEFWDETEKNAAIDKIQGTTIVRYAAAIDNTMLKTLPADKAMLSEPNDALFDMNVESAIKTWEPLAVLHTSADGKWIFVVTESAEGWMHADKAAFADISVLRGLASREFYVVTGSRVTTETTTESPDAPRREFPMGTMLPKADSAETIGGITTLYGRAVLLPERAGDGTLTIKEALLPYSADMSDGWLPCTQANVIKQAFKMLGERYGWGGMSGARDCSSFIRDIYLTFGIVLPRNSTAQTRIPSVHFDTSKMNAAEKEKILAKAPAGTIVQMSGHVMLYLGTVNGKPCIIHDVYALGPSGKAGAEGRKILNCVSVTDMDMTRKNGSTVIDNIKNINIVKPVSHD